MKLSTVFGANLYAQNPYRNPPQTSPTYQTGGCENLSQAEQEFASQLSDLHRKIFCSEFTSDQRSEVLALCLMKSSNYRGSMGYDEAVEMVLKQSRSSSNSQGRGMSNMRGNSDENMDRSSRYRTQRPRRNRDGSCGSGPCRPTDQTSE